MRRLRSVQITTAVVCALGALSGCASRAGVRTGDTGSRLIGIHCELVSITNRAADSVPASAASDTWLEISSTNQIMGRDGCASFQAAAAGSGSTMTISDVRGAANGCLSDHGILDATAPRSGRCLPGGR